MKIRESDIPNINKIGIYLITNLIDGKVYVGKTQRVKGFKRRFSEHIYELNNNLKKSNLHFQNAWNKYGEDNFEFSVLEIVEKINNNSTLSLMINNLEKYWIKFYNSNNKNNGYNLTEGGDGQLGVIATEKTKKLRSISSSKEKNPRATIIYQLDLKGNIIRKYNYIKAVTFYGYDYSAVIECVNHSYKRYSSGPFFNIYGKKSENKTYGEKFIWISEYEFNTINIDNLIDKINSFKCVNNKKQSIVQLTLDNQFIRKYEKVTDVKIHGFSDNKVSSCINHKHYSKLGDNIYGKLYEEKFKWLKYSEYNKGGNINEEISFNTKN